MKLSLLERIFGSEKREAVPFSDAIQDAIFAQASGSVSGDPKGLGALEVCAGLWGRAFASAEIDPISPITAALTPSILALIGRELCRRGECVLKISVSRDGKIRLFPAGSWDVRGGYDPESWVYRLDLFGASKHLTEILSGESVLHLRYATDPSNPWVGLSPLQYARDTGKLASGLEKRLGEETSSPVGALLPIPMDGGDDGDNDPLKMLKSDIRNARGRMLLVETTAAGWGEGKAGAPMVDLKAIRFGAHPPMSLKDLRESASITIYAACGVPPDLAELSQGTAAREAWRRFLHGTIVPISRLVAEELSAKFDREISLGFEELMASDVSGRARAFQSMVGGGMDVERAAALAGLLEVEG